ncbi:hypothetical protein F4861DRAFT_543674 [Xylaria intraflava]|nr:hypothetical protein F4861DRAFT_543674 [Xylaria intraflava]
MGGTKWDDKAERDLFLAMRVAEQGYGNVSKDNAKKVVELMEIMGYPNLTPRTVGERWHKALTKNTKVQFTRVLEGGGTGGFTPGQFLGAPRRGARMLQVKDEAEEEEEEKKPPVKYELNSDDEIVVQEPAKKQKKRRIEEGVKKIEQN